MMHRGQTGGLWKLTDSLVARTLKKQLAADLETLKVVLENQGTVAKFVDSSRAPEPAYRPDRRPEPTERSHEVS